MAAFTHYWTNRTCEDSAREGWQGTPLDHTAGKGFRQRGVREGDRIYVVTVRQGKLFLIGRLTVGRILRSGAEARNVLVTNRARLRNISSRATVTGHRNVSTVRSRGTLPDNSGSSRRMDHCRCSSGRERAGSADAARNSIAGAKLGSAFRRVAEVARLADWRPSEPSSSFAARHGLA